MILKHWGAEWVPAARPPLDAAVSWTFVKRRCRSSTFSTVRQSPPVSISLASTTYETLIFYFPLALALHNN